MTPQVSNPLPAAITKLAASPLVTTPILQQSMIDKYCRPTLATKTMVLIYGPPISGKTTGARTFPNPVIVDFDGNLPEGLTRVIPMWDEKLVDSIAPRAHPSVANRPAALVTVLADLVRDLPQGDTIIVDSLTRVESWYNLQESKIPIRGKNNEIDTRKMFSIRLNYFSDLLTIVTTAKASVVFTVHQQFERNESGDVTGHIKPALMGQIGEKLPGFFPVVLQALRKEDPLKKGTVEFLWRIRPGVNEPARVPKPTGVDFIPQQYSELSKYL